MKPRSFTVSSWTCEEEKAVMRWTMPIMRTMSLYVLLGDLNAAVQALLNAIHVPWSAP